MPDHERHLAEIDQMISSLSEKYKMLLGRQSEAEIARAGIPSGTSPSWPTRARPTRRRRATSCAWRWDRS